MAQLINVYLDPKKFDKSQADGRGCYRITISVGEREDNYGQNVSSWHKVEKGESKHYLFSGRTFWSDKGEHIPKRDNPNSGNTESPSPKPPKDDIPF